MISSAQAQNKQAFRFNFAANRISSLQRIHAPQILPSSFFRPAQSCLTALTRVFNNKAIDVKIYDSLFVSLLATAPCLPAVKWLERKLLHLLTS